MSGYGFLERRLARALERLPSVKRRLKFLYQAGNYWIFGERGFRFNLHRSLSYESISAPWQESYSQTFFGYYEKSPWDPAMGRFVWHRVNADRTLSILVQQRDCVREFARTQAWSWQQGAMTQWATVAGETRLVFNDFIDGYLVSCWCSDEDRRVIPWPVQAVAPTGDFFVGLNYLRLQRLRPDYGYQVEAKNFMSKMPDDQDGLWGIKYDSENAQLLVSLEQLAALTPAAADATDHKVNHVMFSPSGKRFVFLYRWFGRQGKKSRLFLYDLTSSSLKLLLDGGMISHYCWRTEDELIAYCHTNIGDGYYRVNANTGETVRFAGGKLDRYGDGHPSVSPCGRFLITDTYPDRKRQQRLILYRFDDDSVIEVGRFLLPLRFDGVKRVDLHPRWSPDCSKISIDSGHDNHRRTYVLDIGPLLER